MPSPAAKPATEPTPKKPHPNRYKVVNNSPNKGGRPSTKQILEQYKDEAKAFESIKDKWTLISHKLADEALKAARDPKKIADGKTLVSLATAAGISYDKRWSKQVSDTTEIEFPPSLAAQIGAKLAKPLNSNDSECMIQDKSCSEPEQPDAPLDPMLLSPGL